METTNRAQTDKSLDAEREGADKGLREIEAAQQAADVVVDLARREADAVVDVAREKADKETEPALAIDQGIVDEDRAQADELLEYERATADHELRQRRDDERQALARLVPLERERTDRDLLTERVGSDDAIASRDDFLGIVSHDLRNLLGGIVLSSGSLSKGSPDTVDGRRMVVAGKRIQLYAARMNRIIGDLADVASIDAGKLACNIVPSDPAGLIDETLATFRDAADRKQITLVSEASSALPLGAFDSQRMLQVFANLVSNALKFTTQGGQVRIGGEREGAQIHFSVSDTGQGIPQDMLESVFLRFWQSVGNDRRGSGLGLYICKNLIEAHGGRIWVESGVGKGSVFHFTVSVAVP
jgi:signal transduction histidine kinase